MLFVWIVLVRSFDMNFDIDIHLAVTDRARTDVVTILCVESSLSPLNFHVQSMHVVIEMAKLLTSALSMKCRIRLPRRGTRSLECLGAKFVPEQARQADQVELDDFHLLWSADSLLVNDRLSPF
jgi:hypothetical protein